MSIQLRGGQSTEDQRLDRLVPTDFKHVERYSIRALPEADRPSGVPVVLGVNWYSAFDNPVEVRVGARREWWVAKNGRLGYLRGGHCVVVPDESHDDAHSWWALMDQGAEGACVGFGATRAMMLLNRKRYAPRWLYQEAQKIDEWEGGSYPGASPFYEGTSVRAAMDVLRDRGHCRVRGSKTFPENMAEGVSANRWAVSVADMLSVLNSPGYEHREAFPFHNSWGKDYPHKVWIPFAVMERLLEEYGEATMLTDR
jgi:hypothetical protein